MIKKEIIKILVVEDETLLRNHLIKLIKSIKCIPIQIIGDATNGIEAYKIVEKELPDLVISDIKMPGGDGLTLAQKVHDNYPTIKFVILSGYDEFSYAQTALRSDVKDYLLKPIDKELLKTTILNISNQIFSENETFVINNSNQDKKQMCDFIINYLDNNFNKDISIADLSVKCGFTQEYLGKIFKKYTNQTISQYIINLRVKEAEKLLIKYPNMEIYRIAELVGYKDNSFYFSRIFKNKTGIQPSEYRKLNQTKHDIP
ncbi:MAG: response regulator [Spirochaetia bacterium]|nr:response regulator [Spirochaetia bacterium]